MELLNRYSGIAAIIFYSVVLYLFLKLKKRKGTDDKKELNQENEKEPVERLDPNDEDALVACLVASIDCREQYHKNVQILGVRRIS